MNNKYLKTSLKAIVENINLANNKNTYQAFTIKRGEDDKISNLETTNWGEQVKEIDKVELITKVLSNKINGGINCKDLKNIFNYLNDSNKNMAIQDYNNLAIAFDHLKNSKINNLASASITSLNSVPDLLIQYLNEIRKYLNINYKYENKENKKLINSKEVKEYFDNSIFFKNAKFNIDHLLIMGIIHFNNFDNKFELVKEKQINRNGSSFDFQTGKYLLLNDGLFNSSFATNSSANQVGPDGIYTSEASYNQYYKIAISADPPTVRVMYNIDGDIIMGQGISLKKQKGKNIPIYDEEEVFLQNAYFQANVKTNHEHVYYIDKEQIEHLVIYQISSIYTLEIDDKKESKKAKNDKLENKDNKKDKRKYFKNHAGLIKYLQDYLMSQETVYN